MNLIKVERIVFYILLNGFSLLLKPFFRRFKIFDFAVLVYPGTKKDITAYFPGFFKKIFPTISMMGFIKNHKNKKYGIILATKYYIEEIKQKKKEVLWEVERFASLIGVKKIALVGRLPKILFDSNKSLFVEGKIGTVFTVIDSVKTIMLKLGLQYDKINIGVIGVGFIGKEILINLKEMKFASVVGFDTRFEEDRIIEDDIKRGRDPFLLNDCDFVITLTPCGDDIEDLIPFFKNNIIILDDTHPRISEKNIKLIEDKKNGKIYKAAVSLPGIKIFPRIPGFKNNWVPGCVVEIIVSLYNKKWYNQDDFNHIANEIGFHAIFERVT